MYASSENDYGKEIHTEVKNTVYKDTSGAKFSFGNIPEKLPGKMATTELEHMYDAPAPYVHPVNSQPLHGIDKDYSSSLTVKNPLYGET